MEFKQRVIRVTTRYGTSSVPAMVGVGSGLAYHLQPGANASYTITSLSTGREICGQIDLPEREDIARRWLELVAEMTDWSQNRAGIINALIDQYGSEDNVIQAIRDALDRARQEMTVEGPHPQPTPTIPVADGKEQALLAEVNAMLTQIKRQETRLQEMQISLLALLPKEGAAQCQ